MTAVLLRGISKRYPNGFQAVHTLDLEVESGELIALVGPSGCGKSTTLRMIAGLEEISGGELFIDGVYANALAPKERGIGMVFQSYALYPHMTAYDNIAFGLKLQKLPREEIEDRVNTVARQLQISDLLQRKPKQMSGGQRQRVAMARAVARQPQIFLFDEPLSNLDAQLRAEMRVEISKLHRTLGATSFYVTHDQVEAMTLADRVVLLRDGHIQQVGPPMELHDQPANRFVATFIGSPTMNIIRAQVGARSLSFFDAELPLSDLAIDALMVHTQQEVTSDQDEMTYSEVDIGVRPHELRVRFSSEESQEHIRETEKRVSTSEETAKIRCEIELIEPLGSETLIYARPLSHPESALLVARVESDLTARRGEVVTLELSLSRAHLFTPDERGACIRW